MSLEEKIKKRVNELIKEKRKLGEHAGGSGHLAYRSFTKYDLSALKEIIYNDKVAYELIAEYSIYTETEFLHDPEEDDLYTEHYKDKFVFDKDLNLLVFKAA